MYSQIQDPLWPSPELRDLAEHLQNEIAKAFLLPPHLVSAGPRLQERARAEAFRATVGLRMQLSDLHMRYAKPVMLVSR